MALPLGIAITTVAVVRATDGYADDKRDIRDYFADDRVFHMPRGEGPRGTRCAVEFSEGKVTRKDWFRKIRE